MPHKKFFPAGLLILLLGLVSWPSYGQDYRALVKTADDYYRNEHYYNAAQYYQVAVGLTPGQADINYRLAQSYRAIFNYPLAASFYQKTLQTDPVNFPLARFYLGKMQKSIGQFGLAIQNFDTFIRNPDRILLDPDDKAKFLAQARIEKEGCIWALEQMSQGWFETGFQNLPSPVNSANNDYALAIGANDSVVTITSARKEVKGSLRDNRYGEYFTDNLRFEKRGTWQPKSDQDKFSVNNTKFNDGAGTYNHRGDKYYFTSCYEDKAYCQLYVSQLVNGRWRNPKLLNENINLSGYDNRQPTFSAFGDTLIFVSNRPGGKGGNDLWYSVSDGDENWGDPQPVPGKINTPFNEMAPHLSNGILFFSSDGLVGMGGVDVYMAKSWMDEKSEIRNIGIPFNSGFDDNFLVLGSGKGFISSNRGGGLGQFDIYTFDWPGKDFSPWEYFANPDREEEQLRSRVRQYDPSNLYAARDEDQFYYDNLTAEERAHIDRILAAKRISASNFDPKSLAPDDFRYYRRLDIPAKATIERLYQRRISGEDQPTSPLLVMDPVAQNDWLYYQSLSEEERATIDRIIQAKLDQREKYLSRALNPDEIEYFSSGNRQTQYRIEARAQIMTIDSLEKDLQQQTVQADERVNWLEEISQESTGNNRSSELSSVLQQYHVGVVNLPEPEQAYFESLSPVQQNELYRRLLKHQIEETPVSESTRQSLIRDYSLNSSPEEVVNDPSGGPQSLESTTLDLLYQSMPDISEVAIGVSDSGGLETKVQLSLAAQKQLLVESRDSSQQVQEDLEALKQQLHNNWTFTLEENSEFQLEERIAHHLARAESQFALEMLPRKEADYFSTLGPVDRLKIQRLPYWVVPSQTASQLYQLSEWKSQLSEPEQEIIASLSPEDQLTLEQYFSKDEAPDARTLSEALEDLEPGKQEQVWELMINRYPGIIPKSSDEQQLNITGYMVWEEGVEHSAEQPVALRDNEGLLVALDTTSGQGYFEFNNISASRGLTLSPLTNDDGNPPFSISRWKVERAIHANQNLADSQIPDRADTVFTTELTAKDPNLESGKGEANADVPPIQPNEKSLSQLEYEDLSVGAIIYFNFNSYQLRPEAQAELEELARYLESLINPVDVWFGAHTDNVGPRLYNARLSENRGRKAADYLRNLAADIKDSVLAFGESTPVLTNNTGWGRSYNRRVEVRLLSDDFSDYEPATRTYLIKPGVTLSALAKATELTPETIMKLNRLDNKVVKSYQPIRLPANIDFEQYQRLVYDPTIPDHTPEYARYHMVEYGETFFGLARRYNTTVESLERINGFTAAKLKAGTRIRIR